MLCISATTSTSTLIRRSASSWIRVRYNGTSIIKNSTLCGAGGSSSLQNIPINDNAGNNRNLTTQKNLRNSVSISPQKQYFASSSLSKRAARALQQNKKQNNKKKEKEEEEKKVEVAAEEKKAEEAVAVPDGIKQILETGTLPNASSADAPEKKEEEAPVEEEATNPRAHFTTHHSGHLHEFAPRIVVVGVGGAGGNAVNNMIARNLQGVDFLALNTDAQHLSTTLTDNRLQIGTSLTSGLGCGANPDAGRLAAQESSDQITELLKDAHMVFITAGMGGGTGTGAAPVIAEICYNLGILTVGVVTKPFFFEGTHRMKLANEGIARLQEVVDTLIVIPNQNLFKLASDKTSFMESFAMADDVLLAGVRSITDLMTTPGLINLDFADVQSVMHGMGNAMLGTGQACHNDANNDEEKDGGEVRDRAILAADQALSNPLLGESMDIGTAKGMLVNISGGNDMTLHEVDRAAQRITERVEDVNANIIFGGTFDGNLDGCIRVSVVATGIEERAKGDL